MQPSFTSKKRGRRKNPKIRHAALALIREGATNAQIKEIVGISAPTVARIRAEFGEDGPAAQHALEKYRLLVHEKIPHEHRAARLRQLIDQNEQLMVSLKAIERADTVEFGTLSTDNKAAPATAPLFSLPPGTRVAIQVGPGVPPLPGKSSAD